MDEAEPTEAAEREEHPPVPPSTTASLSVDDLLGDTSSEPLLPETDYFKNLCVSAEGILHQDDFLQIGEAKLASAAATYHIQESNRSIKSRTVA